MAPLCVRPVCPHQAKPAYLAMLLWLLPFLQIFRHAPCDPRWTRSAYDSSGQSGCFCLVYLLFVLTLLLGPMGKNAEEGVG